MKYALIITAALIILTCSGSSVYAADQKNTKEIDTSVSASNIKNDTKLSVQKTVKSNYKNGAAQLVDDDGTVYYWGENKDGVKVYALDESGNERKCLTIKNYTDDDGNKVMPVSPKFKQIGDHIYIMYNGSTEFSHKSLICINVSKDLEIIDRFDLTKIGKDMQFIDTNGRKICYAKGRKTIYICDMDGKNKQRLYSVDSDKNVQYIDSIAMNSDFAAFAGSSGFGDNTAGYVGTIDLKTGESRSYKEKQVEFPRIFDDKILWYGGTESSYDELADSDKTSRIYVKNGDKITYIKTESETEGIYLHGCIDSGGRIITLQTSFGIDPVIGTIRVYEKGKCIAQKDFEMGAGLCGFYANGGIAAVSYMKKISDKSAKTILLSYE